MIVMQSSFSNGKTERERAFFSNFEIFSSFFFYSKWWWWWIVKLFICCFELSVQFFHLNFIWIFLHFLVFNIQKKFKEKKQKEECLITWWWNCNSAFLFFFFFWLPPSSQCVVKYREFHKSFFHILQKTRFAFAINETNEMKWNE